MLRGLMATALAVVALSTALVATAWAQSKPASYEAAMSESIQSVR